MMEYTLLGKIIETLGTTGLIVWVIWKLVDRWAGKFLDVQIKQATAMGAQAVSLGALAEGVRQGQGEDRELLIAVRVLATKVDETKAWVKQLNEVVLGGRNAA